MGRKAGRAGDVLINLSLVIISQDRYMAKHHRGDLKYIRFLFVNYTSVRLENIFTFIFACICMKKGWKDHTERT